jgi:hypothetical protein
MGKTGKNCKSSPKNKLRNGDALEEKKIMQKLSECDDINLGIISILILRYYKEFGG